jgi:anaerobic magnesium-protoporphyrin IX monomethyl ester cyclase
MKVLVLNPPFWPKYSRTSRSPAVTKGGTLYYPFWLASAVGTLEQNNFEVKFLDAPAFGQNIEKISKITKDFDPKLIIIETSTPSIDNDIRILERLKKETGAFCLLVGTHVSALPEETIKKSIKIDAIARREYDYIVRDLAIALRDNLDLSTVKGITYRKDEHILNNPDMAPIENLDELPFVSKIYKKHLNVKKYFYAAARYPMVMIITGRGCPFQCFFCNYPQVFSGHRYRLRSAENVVDEFEYITKNLSKVKDIAIEDDTLTADLERVKKICKLIIERGIHKKIKWYANVRVNLDYESMVLMKQAGCRLLIAGYESGVQEILNSAKKGITIDQSREFAKNAKKAGILVHGCFILGLPGETRETIQKTIKFAKELAPDTAQFFPLMPYPGTEAYNWAKEKGYLATEEYEKWLIEGGQHNTVIDLPGLSAKEIVKECIKARKSFYLRPNYIAYKAKQMVTKPEEIKRTLKSAKSFFKHLLI